VLFGALLVAAVIAGLLAMHTLNLHGTPAAHTPAVSVSAADSGAAHQGGTHEGAARTHVTSGSVHDPGGSCAGCGSDGHLNTAMACVLALLVALLLLVPPRMLHGWLHVPSRPVSVIRLIGGVRPEAPSLHVLCISRT
jgi:hypothetical protein